MIRHISTFLLHDPTQAQALAETLSQVRRNCPLIVDGVEGVGIPPEAPPPPGAGPVFAHVVQQIDFPGPQEAAGYPTCREHLELMAQWGGQISGVTAIDFEL